MMSNPLQGQRTIADRPPPVTEPAPATRFMATAREIVAKAQLTSSTTSQKAPTKQIWNDAERLSPQKIKSLAAIDRAMRNHELRLRKYLVDQFSIEEDLDGFAINFAPAQDSYRSPNDIAAFNEALSTALDVIGISDCCCWLAV